jgi:membrane-associated phospholipid phosphatase
MTRKYNAHSWNPKRILLLHSLAGLLAVSLLWSPSAAVWRWLSSSVFYFLNGSLLWGRPWTVFWATLNTKAFDTVCALLLLIPLLWYLYDDRQVTRNERLSRVTLVMAAVTVMTGISKLLLPGIPYPSPSLLLEPFHSLRALVPGIAAKISSNQSFPGDHAVFAFTYIALTLALVGGKYTVLGIILGILYVVPRLVSGAHWLSDDLVGGGIAALIAYSWAIHGPSLFWLHKFWTRLSTLAPIRMLFALTRLPA